MPGITAVPGVVDAGKSVSAGNACKPAAEFRDHANLLAALGQGDTHLAFRAILGAAAFCFVGVEWECGCCYEGHDNLKSSE